MLEKLRLLAQCGGVALPTCRKPTIAPVWCIGRSLLSLLVIERVRQIHPQAPVISQRPPNFVKHVQQVSDVVIRMSFMSEFSLPPVRPCRCGSVTTQQVKRWRSCACLDACACDVLETGQGMGLQYSNGIDGRNILQPVSFTASFDSGRLHGGSLLRATLRRQLPRSRLLRLGWLQVCPCNVFLGAIPIFGERRLAQQCGVNATIGFCGWHGLHFA